MSVNKSEVTVIMVSFYSKDLIEKTISFINKEIEIIVIENSNSSQCKELLEKKYSNVKVILSEENLGNGAGINIGLKKTNTKYAFYIDIDTEIQKDTIRNLLDEVYIQDASDNSRYNANPFRVNNHKANAAEVYLGMPTSYNIGLKINF